MKLVIEEQADAVIRHHGEETYPYECCGFLYGKEADGERRISIARKATNSQVENQERRFKIDPQQYLEAERYALENGLDFLGIYHSHPDHPAIASEHDLRQAMPFFSYFIVSVKKGEAVDLKSWQLNDQGAFEEEIIYSNIKI